MSGVTVNVDADYGALLLGGLLAFGLSGCVNLQFIVYLQVYSEEGWTTKSLVIATWFLDLWHSAFVAAALWASIIAPYGDLSKIDDIPWTVGPTVALTAMVTFLVQSFFAHRLYRLQKEKFIIAGPLFMLAFFRLVAASVSTAEMITLKQYSDFVEHWSSSVFTLGLSLSAFVDIANTTFLYYFLRSKRSSIQSTNRLIDALTFWTVQSGSITCLAAIASLICWLAMPQNRIFLGLHFIIAKLYANSLLATLNARTKFRNQKYNTNNPLPPSISVDPLRSSDEARPVYPRSPPRRAMHLDAYRSQPVDLKHCQSIEVKVQRTVESKYDVLNDSTPA